MGCVNRAQNDDAGVHRRGRNEMLGWPMAELVPDYVSTLPCFRTLRSAVSAGAAVTDDYRYIHKNGALIWLHATWSPIKDDSGKVQYMKCLATDVTDSFNKARETKHLSMPCCAPPR
ncbi:PAS domain-containing protein [Pseudomonas syringae]|uniref:PAS domain-containing protein n=1 Tax=Pseudomonas syringae TaxID=317 RepID=UPI0009B53264